MFPLYFLIGSVIYMSYDIAPADPLRDIQPGSHARKRDLALAITVWCIALAVWPLAVVLRAAETVRRRKHERTGLKNRARP